MLFYFQIGRSSESPPVPEHLSPALRELTAACLQLGPDRRPTAKQMLNHPVLAGLL